MADQQPEQEDTKTPTEGEAFTLITSQEKLNRIITARLFRERQKYADYDELKAASERLAKIEEASKTDLERAEARAQAAEARLAELELREQQAAWKSEVAKKTGVDSRLLYGSTLE